MYQNASGCLSIVPCRACNRYQFNHRIIGVDHLVRPSLSQKWQRRCSLTSIDGRIPGRCCSSNSMVQRGRLGCRRLSSISCPCPQGHRNTAHFGGEPTRYKCLGLRAVGRASRHSTMMACRTTGCELNGRRRQNSTRVVITPTTADRDKGVQGHARGTPCRSRSIPPFAVPGFDATHGHEFVRALL
jgi:hypothetical protein